MLQRRPQGCQVLLVVEDDPAIADMYSYALDLAGYVVVLANSADAALRMAVEAEPDLVLMDIGLPGQSGLEVLREFRRAPVTAHLPVVMLTNYGDPSFVEESVELGALDYLIKSRTSPAMLAERVKGWCSEIPGGLAESGRNADSRDRG